MKHLYSEVQFLPIFHPNTKIYWYDVSNQNKISTGLLGRIFLNEISPHKKDEYLKSIAVESLRISWKEPPFTLPIQGGKPIFEEFLIDTYDLINQMAEKTDFRIYASYCNKYGSLFYMGEDINFFDFWVSFNHLKLIVTIFKNSSFDIHGLCRKLAQVIKSEYELKDNNTIKLFLLYHPVDKGSQDNINSGSYFFEEITIVSLRGTETKERPLFRLNFNCSTKDTLILNTGTYLQKFDWLKQQLLNHLTKSINLSNPNVSAEIEDNIPKISMTINDRLVYFLFNILINNDGFNICPSCNKVLTNGNLYCNRKHMESYIKSTPEGKLSNMVNKWVHRGHLTSEQYTLFVDKGKKLLNKYPYEMVKKHLQSLRKKYGN